MASGNLTLTHTRVKASGLYGAWGGWSTSISGSDYISMANYAHTVYSGRIVWNDSEKLTACRISTTIAVDTGSVSASHSCTIHCYLYTFDPTANGAASPPGGYIGHKSISREIDYNGFSPSFSFSGLNVSGVQWLYFWITDDNPSNLADVIVHNGASCSGTFTITSMTLSISPQTVYTGSDVTISVERGAGTTLAAQIKRGSSIVHSATFDTGVLTVSCLKDWFDSLNLVEEDSAELTVSIAGGTPDPLTGTFTLRAGDDMRPVVGTPILSLVQAASAADFPNDYIANISRAKLQVEVTEPTDAVVESVSVGYSAGTVEATYNSATGKWEVTTPPVTGDTEFIVTATDERGLTGTASVALSGVVPYTPPAVSVNETYTYRCDSLGAKTAGGTHYRILVTATVYTALSGNALHKLTVKVKGDSTETNLSSGVQSNAISGVSNPKRAYALVITVQDKLSGEVTREYTLRGIQRYVVLKRSVDGTYMGVGKAPDTVSGGSTIELPDDGNILFGSGNSLETWLNRVYPVGSIYITAGSADPHDLFGGTWARITDCFLLAASDPSGTVTYTAGDMGGETSHQLTQAELPAVNVELQTEINGATQDVKMYASNVGSGSGWEVATWGPSGVAPVKTKALGTGSAHNNMPPYLAVNVWKRTA